MNCPNCNAPLAEGTSFCPTCGMPVTQQQPGQQPGMQYQQPGQQPGMQYQQPGQQPGMQYQQPGQQPGQQPNGFQQQQNIGTPGMNTGFVDTMKSDPLRICTCIAVFFLFLVAWLPAWVSAFGIGAGLFASDGGVLKLWAFFFFVTMVWTIIVEFSSGKGGLASVVAAYKRLPFSQFYIPAFVLILFLLVIFNSLIRTSVRVGAHYGLCFYLCLIAIALLLVRPIMKMVKHEEYWD